MRWLVLLAALPLLGACNIVTSAEPLFTPADTVGAPALREGLWLAKGEGCSVDTKASADTWPDCARWFLVQEGRLRTFDKPSGDDPGGWTDEPYLLATGKPAVLQLDLRRAPLQTAVLHSEGFIYQALEPTKLDDEARVVAFDSWFVNCGPPPPLDAKAPKARTGQTKSPFKGLVLHKKDPNCTATGPGAVRRAAAASRDFDLINSNQWIRETYP